MSPMMMGIIAVIILVIVAGVFFFLKNRNGSTDSAQPQALNNRPKTLAEQQLELEQQRLNPQPTPAPVSTADDDLLKAQNFINQQDFSSAGKVLKQSIKNNPTRSDVYFMLLNTFALSKDYESFNKFYPTVVGLNNPLTTSQAQNLKRLVDEELAFSQGVSQPAPSVTPVVSTPAPAEDVSMDFDFDLDSNINSTPATSTPTPATKAEPVVEDVSIDFDFDLDSNINSTPTTSTVAPVVDEPVASVEEEALAEFDFDLPSEKAETPVASTPVIEEEPLPDFDFDLPSEKVEPPVAPTPVIEEEALAEFDFDLPSEKAETPVASTPVIEEEALADFNFDLPSETVEVETPVVAKPTPVMEESLEIADDSITDSFSEDLADEPVVAPTVPVSVASDSRLSNMDVELGSAFDVIKNLDANQLNIDLAEQYIHLGEYDSAKRLLNEIQATASGEFASKIKTLLEKID
ncbi:FimV/HubP family polar landmark protein [Moraxella boevrei]|uniref:FimV/HubP family polar landmark protein n=1 Tax=Faucicola boevrei TaxID=346665 RepID=UPI003736F821